jgi:phage gp36-like protein
MALYCTRDDILKQVRPDVLRELADDDLDGTEDAGVVDGAIETASDVIDGYCQPRYPVPFAPIPGVVRRIAVDLAAYNLFARRGFNEQSADKAVVDRYKAAIRLLERIQEGKAAIGVGTMSEPSAPPAPVRVKSRPQIYTDELLERF